MDYASLDFLIIGYSFIGILWVIALFVGNK
jgi:hypothetical protein